MLQELLEPGQEQIGWDVLACVLTLGRFCAQPSELSLAERWYADTALEDLLGVPLEKINPSRLYRGLGRTAAAQGGAVRASALEVSGLVRGPV